MNHFLRWLLKDQYKWHLLTDTTLVIQLPASSSDIPQKTHAGTCLHHNLPRLTTFSRREETRAEMCVVLGNVDEDINTCGIRSCWGVSKIRLLTAERPCVTHDATLVRCPETCTRIDSLSCPAVSQKMSVSIALKARAACKY